MKGQPLHDTDRARFQGADDFPNGDAPLYIDEEFSFDLYAELILAPNGATLATVEHASALNKKSCCRVYHAPFKPPTYAAAEVLAESFGTPTTLEELLAFGFVLVNEEWAWPADAIERFTSLHNRCMQDLVNLGEFLQEQLNEHEMRFEGKMSPDACQRLHLVRRNVVQGLLQLGVSQDRIAQAMRDDGESGPPNMDKILAESLDWKCR